MSRTVDWICREIVFISIVRVSLKSCEAQCMLLLLLLVNSLSGPSAFVFYSCKVLFLQFPVLLISILHPFFSSVLLSFVFRLLLRKLPAALPADFFCLLETLNRLYRLGPPRSGQNVITARHTHTHPNSISKCSTESVVYPVSLRAAQEKLHETPCLLQRSARLRPDLKWIHLSTSWPDLTWMRHSLVSGPRGLLFFSLQFLLQCALVIALTSRPVDGGVWAHARCVLPHIWERPWKVICVF